MAKKRSYIECLVCFPWKNISMPEKEKVLKPLMLSGWHHTNEMNQGRGTKNSFPYLKEKQESEHT